MISGKSQPHCGPLPLKMAIVIALCVCPRGRAECQEQADSNALCRGCHPQLPLLPALSLPNIPIFWYSHEEITYQPLHCSYKGINWLGNKGRNEKCHKDPAREFIIVMQHPTFYTKSPSTDQGSGRQAGNSRSGHHWKMFKIHQKPAELPCY